MKKYRITDADGTEYEVVEEETQNEVPEEEPVAEEIHDGEQLTDDEISALKRLAGMADQIIAFLNKDNEQVGDEEGMENEEIEEEDDEILTDSCDEDGCEEDEEEFVARDSKKSFGALEKPRKHANDALVDTIADAWAKRYNGGNK